MKCLEMENISMWFKTLTNEEILECDECLFRSFKLFRNINYFKSWEEAGCSGGKKCLGSEPE